MNASLLAAAGLMFFALAAPAQTAAKIHYRTPVTEATPLGFTLNLQSRPDGGGVVPGASRPSVVIVSSRGGTAYRGTYYAQPVSYGNRNTGRLNVSGYHYGHGHRAYGWTGSGLRHTTTTTVVRAHHGNVAHQTSCARTVVASPRFH
jgi:hypothetical protein